MDCVVIVIEGLNEDISMPTLSNFRTLWMTQKLMGDDVFTSGLKLLIAIDIKMINIGNNIT